MDLFRWLILLIRAAFVPKTALIAENMALRQQLAVYRRDRLRPQLKLRDRLFWVVLSQVWAG